MPGKGIDWDEVIGGVLSLSLGIMLLVVSATTTEVSYGIGNAIVKAINGTSLGVLASVGSNVRSVISILGVVLIALGGALTMHVLFKVFTGMPTRTSELGIG